MIGTGLKDFSILVGHMQMENSFLWESNDKDALNIDLFRNPRESKRSSLFEDDINDAQNIGQGNYKKMYEAEHQRCIHLEKEVEALKARIMELEVLMKNGDDDKYKDARRIQQYNRQKRSAQASKRKVGTKNTSQILLSDDVVMDTISDLTPAASASISLFNGDNDDSRGRVDSSSHEGVLFDAVGEEVQSMLRTPIPVLSNVASDPSANDLLLGREDKPKKIVSLFDENSSDDSDCLLGQKNNDLKSKLGKMTIADDISAVPRRPAVQEHEVDEEMEEYLRQQERIRLDKQIQRQKQLHRRTQRARGSASGGVRRTAAAVVKSFATTSAALGKTMNSTPSPTPSNASHNTGTGIAQKGPSLWSDDDDDESGSDQWSSSDEEPDPGAADATPHATSESQSTSSFVDRQEEITVKCDKPGPENTAAPDMSHYDRETEMLMLAWCRGKDLAALIYTLPDISLAPGLTKEELRAFDLSSPAQLRKAFL